MLRAISGSGRGKLTHETQSILCKPRPGMGLELIKPSPGTQITTQQLSSLRTMAPRKRSRQESAPSSSGMVNPTTTINESHAVQLARHLAGLRKCRRFTDLKVGTPG